MPTKTHAKGVFGGGGRGTAGEHQRRVKRVTPLEGKGSVYQRNTRVVSLKSPARMEGVSPRVWPRTPRGEMMHSVSTGRKNAAAKFISLLAPLLTLNFCKASELPVPKACAPQHSGHGVTRDLGREKRQRRASEQPLPARSAQLHPSRIATCTRHLRQRLGGPPKAVAGNAVITSSSATSSQRLFCTMGSIPFSPLPQGIYPKSSGGGTHNHYKNLILRSPPRAGTGWAKCRRPEGANKPPSAGGAESKNLLPAHTASASFPNSGF